MNTNTEIDPLFEVTHWMPLPPPPKDHNAEVTEMVEKGETLEEWWNKPHWEDHIGGADKMIMEDENG